MRNKTLSNNQLYILDCIEKNITVKEISRMKNVSTQAVHKTIRKLELKGAIKRDIIVNNFREDYKKKNIDGKNYAYHRLVWMVHIGNIPPEHEIHHIDMNKGNNRIENLMCLHKSDHLKLHALIRKGLPELTKSILLKIDGGR